MKQLITILLLTLFCSAALWGQQVKYESSFAKAKQLAIQAKKPLAVLITIKPPVYTPNFMDGLKDKAVIDKLNSRFINCKVDRSDTAAFNEIIRPYKVFSFPSYLFLDSRGGIMFTEFAFLSSPEPLLELLDRALAATTEKSLVEYDSAYAAGNRGTAFLKDYILRRVKVGITTNANLIEKYVYGLKVSDLYRYNEVLFILKAGPIIDGNAYKLAHLNRYLIDSIYKTEPLANRIALNSIISANTMDSAIVSKNYTMALAAANFTRNSWTKNYTEGQKRWNLKIMQYYIGVKDTTKFLEKASWFYDHYYMRISADSAKKIDSLGYVSAKKKAEEYAKASSNGTTISRSFSFSYANDGYATDLNNAAWNFYNMAAKNNDYLLKAMLWSRRAVELSPKPAFYDTYAHILYRLKLYDEAESMQRKAIELGKGEKADAKLYQEEYQKIKMRTL
jgi:hypothetical protein